MRKPLFLRIVEAVEAHDDYFRLTRGCYGQLSFAAKQKCTTAMRMLALGTAADVVGKMVRMGESTCLKTTVKFARGVVEVFGAKYLREPNAQDTEKLLAIGEARGFPEMLESIDCMHWQWKNCPKGSHNDINVLQRSPVFSRLCNGESPSCNYTVNYRDYNMGYYLANGIYPRLPAASPDRTTQSWTRGSSSRSSRRRRRSRRRPRHRRARSSREREADGDEADDHVGGDGAELHGVVRGVRARLRGHRAHAHPAPPRLLSRRPRPQARRLLLLLLLPRRPLLPPRRGSAGPQGAGSGLAAGEVVPQERARERRRRVHQGGRGRGRAGQVRQGGRRRRAVPAQGEPAGPRRLRPAPPRAPGQVLLPLHHQEVRQRREEAGGRGERDGVRAHLRGQGRRLDARRRRPLEDVRGGLPARPPDEELRGREPSTRSCPVRCAGTRGAA